MAMSSMDHPHEASHLDVKPPPLPPKHTYANMNILRSTGDELKKKPKKVFECSVQYSDTHGQYVENGYIQIYCKGSEEGVAQGFARIEMLDKEKSPLCQKPFSYVKCVKSFQIQEKDGTAITLRDGSKLNFVSLDNKELLGYCKLLCKLPDLVIPEIPKHPMISQEDTIKYTNAKKYGASGIWVVYFIEEGLGARLNLVGLHFVTIKSTDLTFNIYNFHDGQHLLALNHCSIKGTGRVGTLLFLEECKKCPGVLWMYCPDHLVAQLGQSLARLTDDNPPPRPPRTQTPIQESSYTNIEATPPRTQTPIQESSYANIEDESDNADRGVPTESRDHGEEYYELPQRDHSSSASIIPEPSFHPLRDCITAADE